MSKGELGEFKQRMRTAQTQRAETGRKVRALNQTKNTGTKNNNPPRTDEKRTGKSRETNNPTGNLVQKTADDVPYYDVALRGDRTVSIPQRRPRPTATANSDTPLTVIRTKRSIYSNKTGKGRKTERTSKPVENTQDVEVDVDVGDGMKMKMKMKMKTESETSPESSTATPKPQRRKTANVGSHQRGRNQNRLKQQGKIKDISENLKKRNAQEESKALPKGDSRIRPRQTATKSGKKNPSIRGQTKGRSHQKVIRRTKYPNKEKIQADIEKLRQMRKNRQQQKTPQSKTPSSKSPTGKTPSSKSPTGKTPQPNPPQPNPKQAKKVYKRVKRRIRQVRKDRIKDVIIGGLESVPKTNSIDLALRLSPHPSTFKKEEPVTAEPVTATKPVTLTSTTKGTTTTTARTTTTTTGDTTTTATTSKPKTTTKDKEDVAVILVQVQGQATSTPKPNRNKNKTLPPKEQKPVSKKKRIRFDEEEEKKKKKKIKKLKSFLRNETINQFSWLGIDLEPPMKTQKIIYK